MKPKVLEKTTAVQYLGTRYFVKQDDCKSELLYLKLEHIFLYKLTLKNADNSLKSATMHNDIRTIYDFLYRDGSSSQNVNYSAKCESNSEKKGQNNAFWIILAYKAMFCDQ